MSWGLILESNLTVLGDKDLQAWCSKRIQRLYFRALRLELVNKSLIYKIYTRLLIQFLFRLYYMTNTKSIRKCHATLFLSNQNLFLHDLGLLYGKIQNSFGDQEEHLKNTAHLNLKGSLSSFPSRRKLVEKS